MTSKINAITTGAGGIEVTGDSSGEIEFQADGTTVATLTTSGLDVSSGLTFGSPIDIASGGTGQTTATASFNALAPSQTSNSGKYLTTDGTNTSWATIASSQWTTSGSDIYYTTGNVGIGMSSPSYPLDISSSVDPVIRVNCSGTGPNTGLSITKEQGSGDLADWNAITINGNDNVSYESRIQWVFDSIADGPVIGGKRTGSGETDLIFHTNSGETLYERMRIDSSGNLKFNSGYGSVATAYGCRAWVNFNGTGTVAIRDSGNVSSITDHTTGAYSLNFYTNMPDTNYSVTGSVIGSNNRGSGGWGTNPPSNGATGANNYSTSSFRFTVLNNSDTAYVDCDHISIQVFR